MGVVGMAGALAGWEMVAAVSAWVPYCALGSFLPFFGLLAHLAFAAALAMAFRRLSDRVTNRRLPPIRPPLRPISAMMREIRAVEALSHVQSPPDRTRTPSGEVTTA